MMTFSKDDGGADDNEDNDCNDDCHLDMWQKTRETGGQNREEDEDNTHPLTRHTEGER